MALLLILCFAGCGIFLVLYEVKLKKIEQSMGANFIVLAIKLLAEWLRERPRSSTEINETPRALSSKSFSYSKEYIIPPSPRMRIITHPDTHEP